MKLSEDEITTLRYLELCTRVYDIHNEDEPAFLVRRSLVGKGLMAYDRGAMLTEAGKEALEELRKP